MPEVNQQFNFESKLSVKRILASILISLLLIGLGATGSWYYLGNPDQAANQVNTPYNSTAANTQNTSPDTSKSTILSWNFCLEGNTQEEYIKYFNSNLKTNNNEYHVATLEALFKRSDFVNLVEQTKETGYHSIVQLCLFDNHLITFVLWGEFGKNNNTIGIYDHGENRLVYDQKFNKGLGDIGVCNVTGTLEGSVIYNCGGGDGPGGYNTTYLMSPKTGKSTVVKDCTYFEDQQDCKVNLLKL